jgi:hypothetical protein
MQRNEKELNEIEIQAVRWVVFMLKAYFNTVSTARLEEVIEIIIKESIQRHTTLHERTEMTRQATQLMGMLFGNDEIKKGENYDNV